MSERFQHLLCWSVLPIVCFFISGWHVWCAELRKPCYGLMALPTDTSALPPYLLDMEVLLTLPHGVLDEAGVPYNRAVGTYPAAYHATTIAQYGLAQWNAYLKTGDEKYKEAFMIQARWL